MDICFSDFKNAKDGLQIKLGSGKDTAHIIQ